jgi:branched-chain amino acid transport system ATP-binding protein
MTGTVFLSAQGISKSYPAIKVLQDVNLTVAEGDSFAVIGPNGAGKTTLFKVLSGEVFADAGTVVFEGDDISTMPAWRRVRRGFGRTFQVARVFPELTAEENAIVAVESARATGHAGAMLAWWPSRAVHDAARAALDEVGLFQHRATLARLLAYGDRKRLELTMSLALRPRVLMLDEPTAGMSPADRAGAVELIARLKQRHGMTVILTEHDMGVVFGLCNRVAVLNHGEVVTIGTPEEVRANPMVRDIYLGSGHA